MKIIDLCAGIGGFTLAAREVWPGIETAAFVEIDPFCQAILKKHFPESPIYDDLTTFDGRPFRGEITVLSGGIPCQPASSAKATEPEKT